MVFLRWTRYLPIMYPAHEASLMLLTEQCSATVAVIDAPYQGDIVHKMNAFCYMGFISIHMNKIETTPRVY